MSRPILLGLFCLALSACGTIKDGGSQELHVETPGAHDAVCYISNNHIKYRLFTPGSVVVSKRPGDLKVHCLAEGNRERTVVYKQDINKSTYGNVITAGLGAAWDYETGGMFQYPEKIVVDFTNIPAQPMEMPNYHKHLEENPDLGGVEEFRPGRAALIRDKYDTPYELQRRAFLPGEEGDDGISGFTDSDGTADNTTIINQDDIAESSSSSTSGTTSESSSSSGSADTLTRSMNPNVFGPKAPSSGGFAGGTSTNNDGNAPVTLHPAQ